MAIKNLIMNLIFLAIYIQPAKTKASKSVAEKRENIINIFVEIVENQKHPLGYYNKYITQDLNTLHTYSSIVEIVAKLNLRLLNLAF